MPAANAERRRRLLSRDWPRGVGSAQPRAAAAVRPRHEKRLSVPFSKRSMFGRWRHPIVIAQDGSLELLQRRTRVHAEFLSKERTTGLVHLNGLD